MKKKTSFQIHYKVITEFLPPEKAEDICLRLAEIETDFAKSIHHTEIKRFKND